MEAAIRAARPDVTVDLIRGGGGDFIVKADGKVLWNKKGADGDFPQDQQVLDRMKP